MNNSWGRLIDGMCATLRSEVLTRIDDEFARGQVFGVINVLNTFKVRGDWSAGFLLAQLDAQRRGLAEAAAIAGEAGAALPPADPAAAATAPPDIDALIAARDANNRAIAFWLGWLDAERARVPAEAIARVEAALRTAMRAEVDLELRHAPRPLFAEMSSGRESETAVQRADM